MEKSEQIKHPAQAKQRKSFHCPFAKYEHQKDTYKKFRVVCRFLRVSNMD